MLSGNFMYGGRQSMRGGSNLVDRDYKSDREVSKERSKVSGSSELFRTPTADHIYYNVTMTNNSTTDYSNARFSETRTQAIIDNPSNYHMSVVRFTCPTNNIPLFRFEQVQNTIAGASSTIASRSIVIPNTAINTNLITSAGQGAQVQGTGIFGFVQSYAINTPVGGITLVLSSPSTASGIVNITLTSTPYKIAMTHSTTTVVACILYNGLPTNINGNLFTFITNYQQMIDGVVVAFADVWTTLKTLDATTPGTHPPFITFDSTTNLFTMWTDRNSFQPQFTGGTTIYFTRILYDLFHGLDAYPITAISPAITPLPLYENDYFWILVTNNGNNATSVVLDPLGAGPYNTFSMVSSFSTLYSWSHFESLVFTSGSIPIQNESIAAQAAIGSTLTTTNSTIGSSVNSPILTDFNAPKLPVFDKSPIQYTPEGEYRLIDLHGTTPLNRFDTEVFWKDRQNNLYPLILSPQGYASLKILFRRKGALAAPPGSW
jgi:hypothetical protein